MISFAVQKGDLPPGMLDAVLEGDLPTLRRLIDNGGGFFSVHHKDNILLRVRRGDRQVPIRRKGRKHPCGR